LLISESFILDFDDAEQPSEHKRHRGRTMSAVLIVAPCIS